MQSEKLDLVLYGATGVTGRLIALNLVPKCFERGTTIGLAGRNIAGLEAIRSEIGAPDIPLIQASGDKPDSLQTMVRQTTCILSAVGPYQLYGSALLHACAVNGIDYLDVNGEPAWMAQMITTYEDHARQSGARILFSCGFDSVPFDLGVYYLQHEAIKRTGKPLAGIASSVSMCGQASQGSVRTNSESNRSLALSSATAALMYNPYALVPGYQGIRLRTH